MYGLSGPGGPSSFFWGDGVKMEPEYSEWILAVKSTLGFVDTMLFRMECSL